MATSKEYETIEKIQSAIFKAKKAKKDIPISLSLGKEYYRKATSSVYLCGLVNMTAGFVAMIVTSLAYAFQFMQESYSNVGYVIGVFLAVIIMCLIPILLGFKIKSFDTTPRFILGLIITATVVDCLLFAGIAPIIALVFDIIALVRWSTYKDWFYSIPNKK